MDKITILFIFDDYMDSRGYVNEFFEIENEELETTHSKF